MARLTDTEVYEQVERRASGLDAERAPYMPFWHDVARNNQASTSRFLQRSSNSFKVGTGPVQNTKLLNERGIYASEILANGMASGQCSASMPWFKLTTPDPSMRKVQAVKEWLDEVEKAIYDLLANSGFYNAAKSTFRQLGLFGTAANIFVSHPVHGAVNFPLVAGEFWIGQDDALRVDTLMRHCDMTVKQLYDRFARNPGDAKRLFPQHIITAYDNGQYDMVVPVRHLVEPNRNREPGKIDRTNKRLRSIYWLVGSTTKAPLEFSGFSDVPMWAPRWDTEGGEVYSSTFPGLTATPSVKQLQLSELRRAQGTDYAVTPALAGPATLNNIYSNLVPRGITTFASLDKSTFGPIWEVAPQTVGILRETVLDMEERVDRPYYTELFLAITNMRGIQPRNLEEIASRNQEKLAQLGPVTDRVQREMLKPTVDRAFDILMEGGLLPETPEELHGVDLKIEFVSIMAQMQRMIGVGNIERYLSFGGNMLAAFPGIADKINAEEAMDEYAERLGVPARMTRSADEVDKIRQARQGEEQAAKMAAMAPAAVDAAKAAQLLSQTDRGDGQSVLSGLTGAAA